MPHTHLVELGGGLDLVRLDATADSNRRVSMNAHVALKRAGKSLECTWPGTMTIRDDRRDKP